MRYKVEERDTHFYVVGLKEEFGESPDTMLLYHLSSSESETPEIDAPRNVHRMYGALYDLYQCHDGLKKGDIFETQFGEFECVGVHVVPKFTMPPEPPRNRISYD